jgi:pantoate--beta-alanine ligase
MQIVHTIGEARTILDGWRRSGASVGFVPTMGALHAGHRTLIERAVAECDRTAVSVFVNPLQFGANEDLSRYPRTLDADSQMASQVGADLVFAPSVNEMYPQPVWTSIRVGHITDPLEGANRPGHFDGVATVVHKLFNIIGACTAYFGEKDWQQLATIRRMVADLSIPVDIIGCPTVRERDGLALSSRNVFLDPEQRHEAVALSRALRHGVEMIAAGERDPSVVEEAMAAMIPPMAKLDYIVVVDAATLQPVSPLVGALRLLVAARFPSARLIDNMGIDLTRQGDT